MRHILSSLLVLISLVSLWGEEKRILKVGWEQSPPYQYNDSTKLTGLDIEIPRKVLEQSGEFAPHFITAPWKRQLYWIESGELDIILGASITEERKKFAHFSIPYRFETVALYVRASAIDSFEIKSVADLPTCKMRNIGIFSGSYYGEVFESLLKDSTFAKRVEPVFSDLQNLNKLEMGRIDGFLMDPLLADQLLKKHGKEELFVRHAMDAIEVSTIHFMYSKKNISIDVIQKLDTSIKLLLENGVIDSLITVFLKEDLLKK